MSYEPSGELAGRIIRILDTVNDPGVSRVVDDAFRRAAACGTDAQGFGSVLGSLALGIGNAEAETHHSRSLVLLEILRLVCVEWAIRKILDELDEIDAG